MGHLMSEFLAAQWSSLHYLVTCAVLGVDMGQGGVDMAHYAAKCLDTVDLIRREELTSVFQCFKTIMPKVCETFYFKIKTVLTGITFQNCS